MNWVFVYIAGVIATLAIFVVFSRITGPHYGTGANPNERAAMMIFMAIFWPIALPVSIVIAIFCYATALISKLIENS